MNEDSIKIINTSYHKQMTDRHLAQVNFVALIPKEMYDKYIEKTTYDKRNLGRIRFMETVNDGISNGPEYKESGKYLVWGRVSHGYGYGIEQDIAGSL